MTIFYDLAVPEHARSVAIRAGRHVMSFYSPWGNSVIAMGVIRRHKGREMVKQAAANARLTGLWGETSATEGGKRMTYSLTCRLSDDNLISGKE